LNAARMQLKEFVNTMNGLASGSSALKTFLETRMDVDQFLRAYAVNVMVGMWDDYWHGQNNYYFYFDENNKFYFIPFDYDNTLGTSMGMNASDESVAAMMRRASDERRAGKIINVGKKEDSGLLSVKEKDPAYEAMRRLLKK
jgi:spore coat protein CotH